LLRVGQLLDAQLLEELDEHVELIGQSGYVLTKRVVFFSDEKNRVDRRESGSVPDPLAQVVGLQLPEDVLWLACGHELIAALGHRQIVVPLGLDGRRLETLGGYL